MLKKVKRVFVKFLILVVGPYILPNFMVFYFVCGAYDFSRNSPFSWRLMNNYCFSRGTFLWAMSPLNILLDLLTLPFLNKKVYRLEDFPQDYQREIKEVIEPTHKTLEDSRGLITSDYQNHLEKEWIASLRKKYSYSVNKKVLKALKEELNQ